MRKFSDNPNVDNSDLSNYPDARIKDNSGAGDGTDVNERVYGDVIQFFLKLKRLAGITENNLPDNETFGYQTIQALKEFASKNNYIQNLSSVSGVLNVSAKLGLMNTDEFLICKASSNLGIETQIKGTDGTTFTITTIGVFKTNEYVRLIKTASTIVLVRISDSVSLDLMISELLYLKKASDAEELAGTIDTKATTPRTNILAFAERVNGATSASYLATAIRNGLYPKEHFSIVAGLVVQKNIGWFSGLDVGVGGGVNFPVSGDFTNAVSIDGMAPFNTAIEVTMANAMTNLNYKVNISVESEGNLEYDNDLSQFVFKKVSTTKFRIACYKTSNTMQNLKIHIEVQQL